MSERIPVFSTKKEIFAEESFWRPVGSPSEKVVKTGEKETIDLTELSMDIDDKTQGTLAYSFVAITFPGDEKKTATIVAPGQQSGENLADYMGYTGDEKAKVISKIEYVRNVKPPMK